MQSDQRLRQQYNSMSARFLETGLATDFIAQARQRYKGAGRELAPVPYSQFPEPLGASTVRLLVVPLAPQAPEIVNSIQELSQTFQATLPAGTDLYINEPSRWHITIFHTSKFDDTRPNPLGPAPSQIGDLSPSARQLSSPAELQQEKEAMQQVVAESPAATLEVYKVLLADSGTLLVCCVDINGHLSQLRERLKAAFPGAPTKQTQIIHVSVLRILTAQQLDSQQRKHLQAVCDQFTDEMKGMRLRAHLLWYILETMFSNIEGDVHLMSTAL